MYLDIEPAVLSPYQKELLTELDIKKWASTKLVPNRFDKQAYVVHYRHL